MAPKLCPHSVTFFGRTHTCTPTSSKKKIVTVSNPIQVNPQLEITSRFSIPNKFIVWSCMIIILCFNFWTAQKFAEYRNTNQVGWGVRIIYNLVYLNDILYYIVDTSRDLQKKRKKSNTTHAYATNQTSITIESINILEQEKKNSLVCTCVYTYTIPGVYGIWYLVEVSSKA